MRLIDADELGRHKFLTPDAVEAKKWLPKETKTYQQGWNEAIDVIIDNAPTVDFEKLGESLNCQIRAEYGSCDDCELSCPRNELIKLLDSERPTGEWIVGEYMDCHSDILPKYTCPFCGEVAYRKYDFCHCGADMRKEEEV